MSRLAYENQARWARAPEETRRERSRVAPRRTSQGSSSGMLLATLAVVGLGVLAWHYVGKDVIRYIRIRNM